MSFVTNCQRCLQKVFAHLNVIDVQVIADVCVRFREVSRNSREKNNGLWLYSIILWNIEHLAKLWHINWINQCGFFNYPEKYHVQIIELMARFCSEKLIRLRISGCSHFWNTKIGLKWNCCDGKIQFSVLINALPCYF